MLGLSISKIIIIYDLAQKLYKHYKEKNFDLFIETNRQVIAGKSESAVDSDEIFCKIVLRLDATVPYHLHFNHFLFLSVILVENNKCSCSHICSECVIHKLLKCSELSHLAPWGGVIGPGMTLRLHSLLSPLSSILKIHAVFHDAYGHLYRTHKKGPGYTYALPYSCLPNYFWLGHFTGCMFFLWLKVRFSNFFRSLDILLK